MPEATRICAGSGAESEPESPMESEAAPESSRRRRKKEKKEKKSKRHDKARKRKPQTDESEQSEEESSSPKLKKAKTGGKQNGHVREESPENARLSSVSAKSTHKKRHSNSSETSSGDGDSDQEQEMTEEQKEGAFSNFPISKGTIQLLQARGVTYLFPVQVKTFNPVYSGKDVIAQARTGTGKTFSFAIPLIEKLQADSQERRRGRSPKVLVLAPTRELANQVAKDFKDITRKLTVACFYGGTPYNGQIDLIRSGIDILVGTPGRIKDHLQNGKLDLTKVKHVVLDEVDQMLDMGFAEQVEDILRVAYKKDSEDNPQTLLFSATCPNWVYDVAKKYMKSKYEQVDLIGRKTQKAATTVEHLAIECHWSQRAAVIGDVIQVYSGSYGRTIVFCETKKDANELALNASIKQDCQSLHGDIPQKQREITLKGFRNGAFKVLVATNVAARGLDIPEVDLVVQSSPPKDVESYIHRSGRTGRAGRTGICICFYQRKEENQLRYVEVKAGITFKRVGVPTATDIIKASSKDAIRCLDSVPQTAIEYFKESAQLLIEEKGPVNALAAALAHISGATSIEQRSLLNSDVGFVTMVLRCSEEINNMSYVWRRLREQLGGDVDRKVNRMRFIKGRMGVCFDIPVADQKDIEERWEDSKQCSLCVANELPELEESQRGGGGGGGGGGGAAAAVVVGVGSGSGTSQPPPPSGPSGSSSSAGTAPEGNEELEEEGGLGEGDGGDAAIEDPELEAIKARVREMEEEAEKLKELQNEVEKQMNMSPPPGNAGPVIMSLEEKMEADARSIYVGNVDYGATAEELEAHFHGCGSVNRVTILCDKYSGHPKGFAYIEFSEKESVRTSMALDESLFRGRQIKVIPKRTNRPGISTTDRGFPRARYRGRGGGGGYGATRARFYSGYSRPRGRAYRGRARATSWYSPY